MIESNQCGTYCGFRELYASARAVLLERTARRDLAKRAVLERGRRRGATSAGLGRRQRRRLDGGKNSKRINEHCPAVYRTPDYQTVGKQSTLWNNKKSIATVRPAD